MQDAQAIVQSTTAAAKPMSLSIWALRLVSSKINQNPCLESLLSCFTSAPGHNSQSSARGPQAVQAPSRAKAASR
jgi:hypothetical protein